MTKYYYILDTETTGYNFRRDRIIEIAILKAKANGFIVDQYNSLVNPVGKVPNRIQALTGLSQDELNQAPLFKDIKGDIHEFLDPAWPIYAYNADFDRRFLVFNDKRFEFYKFIDYLKIVRRLISKEKIPNYKLHTLINLFKLDLPLEHRALNDVKALNEIIQILTPHKGQVVGQD